MFLIDPPRRFALRQAVYILREGVSQGILVIERCVQLRFMPVAHLQIYHFESVSQQNINIDHRSSIKHRSLAY